ncbi:MAG TPA: hypothetical protein PKI46_08975, partial [Bacteroidales bacterium]|nr:hypothetical protein [Bacteroidales bacterium]
MIKLYNIVFTILLLTMIVFSITQTYKAFEEQENNPIRGYVIDKIYGYGGSKGIPHKIVVNCDGKILVVHHVGGLIHKYSIG